MPTRRDVEATPQMAGRRLFLARTALCAGGLACLACSQAFAEGQQAQPQPAASAQPEKFGADAKMSFKDVWHFAYDGEIGLLKALGNDIGREKLLPMLQSAASKAAAESIRKSAPPAPKNTLKAFIAGMKSQEYFWDHVVTMRTIEETEHAAEVRVTECLWAATFRAADAGDIGYATVCHPDFAAATAFNPKMRMVRTKTLMQGHDCCNHRWVVEA